MRRRPDCKKLGERIRSARQAKGMTQSALALLCGVSRAAVAKWEAGDRHPRKALLIALADVLGVSATGSTDQSTL